MNGRTPTKDEREWLEKCQQVPCIVCAEWHGVDDTPAEIHHINGQRKPGAHFLTLSLCTRHHRHPDAKHKRWISRHGDGKKAFEERYATEGDLLAIQHRYVEQLETRSV